jgi:hypothetical protein
MKLGSQASIVGAVTVITLAICFLGIRSELARAHRSANQSAAHLVQLDRSEADRYCARRIADGC